MQKKSTRNLEKLELVHSNVSAMMEVDSLGSNKYFVTFIGDASRKILVYLLPTKGQAFQYFHKFHAMVKRETRNPLRDFKSIMVENTPLGMSRPSLRPSRGRTRTRLGGERGHDTGLGLLNLFFGHWWVNFIYIIS